MRKGDFENIISEHGMIILVLIIVIFLLILVFGGLEGIGIEFPKLV